MMTVDVPTTTAHHRPELRVVPITAELLLHGITVVKVRVLSRRVVGARPRPMSAPALFARRDDCKARFPFFGDFLPLSLLTPQSSGCLPGVAEPINHFMQAMDLLFVFVHPRDCTLDSVIITLIATVVVVRVAIVSL